MIDVEVGRGVLNRFQAQPGENNSSGRNFQGQTFSVGRESDHGWLARSG